MAKKKNWVLIAIVLVGAFLLLNGGFNLGSSSIVGGFEQGKLYEPAIGTITCIEGQNSPTNLTLYTPTSGAEGNLFKMSIFDPDLADYGTSFTFMDFINYTHYKVNEQPVQAKYYFSDYTCNQSHCELAFGTNPENWISCPSGYKALYKFMINANTVGQNSLVQPLPQSTEYVSTITTPISSPTISQNASARLMFACVRPRAVSFATITSTAPTGLNYSIQVYQKQFQIQTPGDVPAYIPSTSGCTWNALYNSLNGHQLSPENESVLAGIVNVVTGQHPVSQSQVNDMVPPQDGISHSTTTEPYGLNVQKTFVAGWREISGVNVLTLANGDMVVYSSSNNRIYKVNPITLSNNATAYVANQIWRENPQCYYDTTCQSTFGSTWQCKKTGTDVAQLFTCFNTAQGGGNACTPATQLVDCGEPFYRQTGQTAQYVSPTCSNGQCVLNPVTVICNPNFSGSNNGCPTNKPVCAISTNGGSTYCTEQVQPKISCEAECCKESSSFYAKDCPDGKYCDDGGGLTGICKENLSTCGNGRIDEGENCTSCPSDVIAVNGETACGSNGGCNPGYHRVVKDTTTYLVPVLNWFPNVSTTTSCVPDIDLNLIIIVAVIVIGAIFVFFPGLLKGGKKGGKKR